MNDELETLNALRDAAHATAAEHGFAEASFGERIALVHSELSEALEDFRKGLRPNEHAYEKGYAHSSPSPKGIPSELADVLIRVLDMCGAYDIDIGRAVREKMAYNRTRPYRHGNKKL